VGHQQQREELVSAATSGPVNSCSSSSGVLGIGWESPAPAGVSPGVSHGGRTAHQLPEALAEPRRQQVVDDGVDSGAEVEEHAGQDVHALVDGVHVVRPLADGAPQQPLHVEGCPAHAEHANQDGCTETERREQGPERKSRWRDLCGIMFWEKMVNRGID